MPGYGYKGWIKLWREEMHNPLYFSEPFTKWQAWIDLQLIADENQIIKTSLEALKNRWFWGSTWKVTKYLKTLSQMDLITLYQIPNKGTQIRINKGFSDAMKAQKQTVCQTDKQTDNQIEESLPKEVVVAASLNASRTTPTEKIKNNNSNNYLSEYERLMVEADLGPEYE